MKFKSLACTGISFFSLLQPIVSLSATKQPNILFFMVDDMGWQDTSVPFADEKTLFNNLYEGAEESCRCLYVTLAIHGCVLGSVFVLLRLKGFIPTVTPAPDNTFS